MLINNPPIYTDENLYYTFTPTQPFNHLPIEPMHRPARYDEPESSASFNYMPINVGNSYNNNRSGDRPRRTDNDNLSQNQAIVYLFLLGLASLTLLPYGIYAAYKTTKKLTERPINSLWRLYFIGTGIVVGIVKGATLGAAIGTALSGLGIATGALLGAITCPLIGAGIGALIGKYTAKFLSWTFSKQDDVSSTNHGKYRVNDDVKQSIGTALSMESAETTRFVTTILKTLRAQKNSNGIRAYIPMSKESNDRIFGNTTLRKIKSGAAKPYTHGKYLFFKIEGNEGIGVNIRTKEWTKGIIDALPPAYRINAAP